MIGEMVVCQKYRAAKMDGKYDKSQKKTLRNRAVITNEEFERVNANFEDNGIFYVKDDAATEKYYKDSEVQNKARKEAKEIEAAAGKGLKAALSNIGDAAKEAIKESAKATAEDTNDEPVDEKTEEAPDEEPTDDTGSDDTPTDDGADSGSDEPTDEGSDDEPADESDKMPDGNPDEKWAVKHVHMWLDQHPDEPKYKKTLGIKRLIAEVVNPLLNPEDDGNDDEATNGGGE